MSKQSDWAKMAFNAEVKASLERNQRLQPSWLGFQGNLVTYVDYTDWGLKLLT